MYKNKNIRIIKIALMRISLLEFRKFFYNCALRDFITRKSRNVIFLKWEEKILKKIIGD